MIVAVLPLIAGYIVLVERKVMADMQVRLGPMRVGPHGLLQPIADALKLLIKEDIIPESADKFIFWGAPLISVTAAMLALSVVPIGPFFQIADLNVGLLFILGVSALGIFGIVLGGWASNSHYSLLGALRSAAQLVSYETSAGMAVVGVLLLAGTLSTRAIVQAQADYGTWFVFGAPIGFFIYLVASIAETNRAPFDMPEAESELVAGLHDRVQRVPLGSLLSRGIHEHGRGLVDCHDAVSGRLVAAFFGNAVLQFSRFLSAADDAGNRRVLLLSRAQAARPGAETFHGGGGPAVRRRRAGTRRAAGGARG